MQSNDVLLALFVISGLVGAVAIIGAFVFGIRKEAMKHEQAKLSHDERMRTIELGQPLPDGEVARADAEAGRANAAALIGTLVPIAAFAAAAGISWIILREPYQGVWGGMHPYAQFLVIIWPAAGVVSLVAVLGSVRALRRMVPGKNVRDVSTGSPAKFESHPVDVKERISSAGKNP